MLWIRRHTTDSDPSVFEKRYACRRYGDIEQLRMAPQGVLGRDEATGKTYLKIPLPEVEAMNRIVSGLGQLRSGFMGMNRQQ